MARVTVMAVEVFLLRDFLTLAQEEEVMTIPLPHVDADSSGPEEEEEAVIPLPRLEPSLSLRQGEEGSLMMSSDSYHKR